LTTAGLRKTLQNVRKVRRIDVFCLALARLGKIYAFRNVGDEPARVLILSAPSCGLDQMLIELDAAGAAGCWKAESSWLSPPNMASQSSRPAA